jgi:hypothetical protein
MEDNTLGGRNILWLIYSFRLKAQIKNKVKTRSAKNSHKSSFTALKSTHKMSLFCRKQVASRTFPF